MQAPRSLTIRNVACLEGFDLKYRSCADIHISGGQVTRIQSRKIDGGVQNGPTASGMNAAHADGDALVVDGTGYVALPGLINAAMVWEAGHVSEALHESLSCLDAEVGWDDEDAVQHLTESLIQSLHSGTTSSLLLSETLPPETSFTPQSALSTSSLPPELFSMLENIVVPLSRVPDEPENAKHINGKSGKGKSWRYGHQPSSVTIEHGDSHGLRGWKDPEENIGGKPNGHNRSEGSWAIVCPSLESDHAQDEITSDHQVLATGSLALYGTNLWKELEVKTRESIRRKQQVTETFLKRLFRSVTSTPAQFLEDLLSGPSHSQKVTGTIAEGSAADLILVKLDAQFAKLLRNWQQTSNSQSNTLGETGAILLKLFLQCGSNPTAFVHAVLKRGELLYAAPGSRFVSNVDALKLEKYYHEGLHPEMGLGWQADGAKTSDEGFDTIEDAIEEIRKGNIIVVVDNEDRENEGDLIMAAEDATPEKMAFMIRYTSGVICVPAVGSRLDELELPLMVERNTESLRTAYTITVDYRHGTTTGISAADRAATVRALATPNTVGANDFNRPGHVFPLRYTEGGVLRRSGHTEASVDFCKLAGKYPAAAICEVALDNGTMARRDDLKVFAKKWGLKLVTIEALAEYRRKHGFVEGF
ncbi:hypothetical protein HK102_012307 [Quaeritorhiza haematococci]|nr:hypothetical protein HK102_012307 [Quaeritorhiza haematococci]